MATPLPSVGPTASTAERPRPLRVLHVLSTLTRGGIQNWLTTTLTHQDRERIRSAVVVQTLTRGDNEPTLEQIGVPIYRCTEVNRPWAYAKQLRRIIDTTGPFDVIHSHNFTWNGLVLRLARQAGVPSRFSHSHNADSWVHRAHPILWPPYAAVMRRWIRHHATDGLACSDAACAALYGRDWGRDPRWHVLPYGIDLSVYDDRRPRAAWLRELRLPDDAVVVGNASRLAAQKNPEFQVEIAAALCRRHPRLYYLFVGDGPERSSVQQHVDRLDLRERVRVTGMRSDAPQLMADLFEALVFPSKFEGFGLTAIEAQGGGTPVFRASHLPAEVDVVGPLVHCLDLDESAEVWATHILDEIERGPAIDRSEALSLVMASPYSANTCAATLTRLYESSVRDNARPNAVGSNRV